jgi:hypothetical protein
VQRERDVVVYADLTHFASRLRGLTKAQKNKKKNKKNTYGILIVKKKRK